MSEADPDPLDGPATGARLRALHRRGVLDDGALVEALAGASAGPSGAEWALLLDRTLLATGAGLCVAAVIYFFAGNWAALPDAAKLGGAMALVAACAGWALRAPERRSGRVALVAASWLTGALLAVYGQTYQTGADAWTLFAAWAGLLVPWVLAARHAPLTLSWLVVATVGLGLAMDQGALPVEHEESRWAALTAVPGVAWVLGEALGPRVAAPRWFVRVVALGCLFGVAVLGGEFIVDARSDSRWPAVAVVLASLPMAAWSLGLARRRPIDLQIAAALWLVGIIWASLFAGRLIFDSWDLAEFGLLVMALLVIGQVGAAAVWLRRAWRAGAR